MSSKPHHRLISTAIYILSISIYLHPLTLSPTPSQPPSLDTKHSLISRPSPQLDELHITDPSNTDVNGDGTTAYGEAWHNDYWGRPLDSSSSHKSWRPVCVWSFRLWRGRSYCCRWLVGQIARFVGEAVERVLSLMGLGFSSSSTARAREATTAVLASELFTHRFINVLIHTCLVQLIGALSLLLFPNQRNNISSYLAQIMFAIHPTHVEAVANAANRPHILGLLFNLAIVDPSCPLVGVAVCNMLALLTAETALFQLPAVVVTMTAVRYRQLYDERSKSEKVEPTTPANNEEAVKSTQSKHSTLLQTIITLLPRYTMLLFTTSLYLFYRLVINFSLSIPKGLIRPAENPFYTKIDEWTLLQRVANYGYTTSLHVFKSFGIEIVGMSHEYGYDCIPEIQFMSEKGVYVVDVRLGYPLLLLLGGLLLVSYCWYGGFFHNKQSKNDKHSIQSTVEEERTMQILLLLVFLAWMATLFPIAGIFKVGTFIADRIVVASTVGTCIFGGRLLSIWINGHDETNTKQSMQPKQIMKAALLIYVGTIHLAKQTHTRTSQWMDSIPLLESSLQSCPTSIKSNLEMSKLYSGLVPHKLDLKKALALIETAHRIDPTYCDVHQQYGHVYFQQGRYLPFEEAMVHSLMCPFTMGAAMTNWKRYWNVVLSPRNGVVDVEGRKRYDGYMKRIEEMIKMEAEIAADDNMVSEDSDTGDGGMIVDEL
eukprot:scaffold14139_cov74-Cyclotella_meneghiniana.AAC.11